MNNVKVSVIVPAYNVEKYIEKCVCSVCGQSYRNIEIIVVNDGSTDSTEEILVKMAKTDNRVNVISVENSGVSAARNCGIDNCTGDYVVFVDGDDYLASDYVEYMMSIVEKTGAEFCLSKNCFTQSGESQVEKDNIENLSGAEATALLLSPRVIVGCWNKIFSRDFIEKNKMRFSTTLFYGEGLSFITTAAQVANCVGVGNRKVYYYRRNNEASATTQFDIRKFINGEKALKTIKNNMILKDDRIDAMYYLHMALFSLGAVAKIKSNKKEKEYKKEYTHWKQSLQVYTGKVLVEREVSVYRKAMLLGGCFSPWMMMNLDKIRRKRIAENSVEE